MKAADVIKALGALAQVSRLCPDFKAVEARIKQFSSLPIASIDQIRHRQGMDGIGKTPLEVVPK